MYGSPPGQFMSARIVIIGAGQAGAMVGDEPFPPYQRRPLSKAYLAGTFERERLFLKPDAFYAEAKCEVALGVNATVVGRAAKRVSLSDGRALDYDKLLFATGARV